MIQINFSDVSGTCFRLRQYDSNLDNIVSVLIDICWAIRHKGDFSVSGFGQSKWPVDVVTDLPVFLEQLPDFLTSIRLGENANLDFYEQGVERYITFTKNNDHYVMSCMSMINWIPNPDTETIHQDVLISMMYSVIDVFIKIMGELSPSLLQHQWIKSWINGCYLNSHEKTGLITT